MDPGGSKWRDVGGDKDASAELDGGRQFSMPKVGFIGLELASRNNLWKTVYSGSKPTAARTHPMAGSRHCSEQQVHRWSIRCCRDEAQSRDDGGSSNGGSDCL